MAKNQEMSMIYILIFFGISVFGFMMLYVYWQITRLPNNRPERFQGKTSKKVVILAGDSITHGRVGENYVNMLSRRFDQEQYEFVNAGINSQLAWNLLQRIDDIIDCEPDFITILIGTNDANAATFKSEAEKYVKRMKLPQTPNQSWFRENLFEIVSSLKQKTSAHIALVSIPSLGEDPDNFAHKLSTEYSKTIEEVAKMGGVTYLPFHEKMLEVQKETPGNATYPIEKYLTKMIVACCKHYLLGKDWNSIGESYGFHLHIDYL
ncbi:MAG: SGNH/GDSL hydrolase family protein, partial [Candidatus Thorarchaeota archaeon]